MSRIISDSTSDESKDYSSSLDLCTLMLLNTLTSGNAEAFLRLIDDGLGLHRWVFAFHLRNEIGDKLPPGRSSPLIVQAFTGRNPAINEVV